MPIIVCGSSRGLRSAGLVPVERGRPLPLRTAGSVRMADAWTWSRTRPRGRSAVGLAIGCWKAGDVVGPAARGGAAGRDRGGSQDRGVGGFRGLHRDGEALEPDYEGAVPWRSPRGEGPQACLQAHGDKKQEIRAARAAGRSMAEVAEACGVSLNSVSGRCAATTVASRQRGAGEGRGKPLVRSPAPSPGLANATARAGLLAGRHRCSRRASLPLAGGPCSSCRRWWPGVGRRRGEGVRDGEAGVLLRVDVARDDVVFSRCSASRGEGLSRLDPVALAACSMDRAPEVGTCAAVWRN